MWKYNDKIKNKKEIFIKIINDTDIINGIFKSITEQNINGIRTIIMTINDVENCITTDIIEKIYYDNTKVNIIFYGIFNQKIDEEKLISNIIYENKFGKKGIVTNNYLFNLNNYDFIVFYKKIMVE